MVPGKGKCSSEYAGDSTVSILIFAFDGVLEDASSSSEVGMVQGMYQPSLPSRWSTRKKGGTKKFEAFLLRVSFELYNSFEGNSMKLLKENKTKKKTGGALTGSKEEKKRIDKEECDKINCKKSLATVYS